MPSKSAASVISLLAEVEEPDCGQNAYEDLHARPRHRRQAEEPSAQKAAQ